MTAATAATAAGVLAAATLGGAGLLRWLRWRYAVVVVRGVSMAPTLRSGDRVLLRRTRPEAVRTGQIVVLGQQRVGRAGWDRLVVKRVAAVAGEPVPARLVGVWPTRRGCRVPPGRVAVLGDNDSASLDSRHWGYLDQQLIRGVVLRTLPARPKGGEIGDQRNPETR